MSFVVLEEDPFIRSDICEILQSGYPDRRVLTFSLLGDLPRIAASSVTPLVAVISTDRSDIASALETLGDAVRTCTLVLIADFYAPDALPNRRCRIVTRPFSTDTLLAAVQAVAPMALSAA